MTDVRGAASVDRDLVRRVMRAVRELGSATSFDGALQCIVDHVVDLLDFAAAAVNVVDGHDDLVVRAVSGPDGGQAMLGERIGRELWTDVLARCPAYGGLLFGDHRILEATEFSAMPRYFEPVDEPVADGLWQHGDSLLAPVYDEHDRLVVVLSADLRPGSVHDTEQLAALELFAAEAGSAVLEWTARAEESRRRQIAEARWRVAWDNGLVAAGILDQWGVVLDVNDQSAGMLGFDRAQMVGRNVHDYFVPPENRAASLRRFRDLIENGGGWVQERELRRADGRSIWTQMHAVVHLEGDPPEPVVLVQFTDITERRLAAQTLARQLDHDALTDLPNRRRLEDDLAVLQEEQEAGHRAGRVGVLVCVVEGLDGLTQGLGRESAEQLLVGVAGRLRVLCADGLHLARTASDAFTVVVPETDADSLADLGEQVTDTLARPIAIAGVDAVVHVGIGMSVGRGVDSHATDVLREAEEAVKRAERRGQGNVEMFDPGLDRPLTRADLELEMDLRRDLDRAGPLEPRFQSVISLASGEVAGHELLIRWRHPELGMLLPERFIPVAERSGLSAELGWHVLRLVAEAQPPGAGRRGWIAVNLSAAQLGRGRLLEAVRALFDSPFAEAYSELHLEIGETSLLHASPAVVDELYAVVELGARLAIDDFGTGYSSLTLLRDLPVSAVKIDRSFIRPIAVDVRARTIVQHSIELCRGLGMMTIAEGIETHEQLAWLQTLGCEYGQGFLIDQPSAWFSRRAGTVVPPSDVRRFEI